MLEAATDHGFDAPIAPIRVDDGELDPAADPHADLDAHVNARWRAANPLPPDRSCWDAFAILSERSARICARLARDADRGSSDAARVVSDLWTSGNDEARIERLGSAPLEDALDRIARLDTPSAILAWIAERHAAGHDLAFRLDAEPAFDEPSKTIASISQGGLALPDASLYLDATTAGRARLASYRSHVAGMLALAGHTRDDAVRGAGDVLAIEMRLARASTPRRALIGDVSLRQRRVAIDTAERETPGIPWRAFFAALGIAPTELSLAMPAYFAELSRMLGTLPAPMWRSYLAFHAIEADAPLLSSDFVDAHERFHRGVLRGQAGMTPRWRRVLATIDAHAGEALGELYAAADLDMRDRRDVEAIATRLVAALRARIEAVGWLGADARQRSLAKLDTLGIKIGAPHEWPDWSALATHCGGWHANASAARAFARRRLLARIDRPTDRARWRMLPQTVNAGYDPQLNDITFPAAILKPPFFDADAGDAVNLGAIGAVIAHEMTHALDDQGSRFDASGRLVDGWSANDRQRFERAARRLADQVDALGVDGTLTLGENIADLGGLATAWDAFAPRGAAIDRDAARRFFIAWAALWRQNLSADEARFRRTHDRHAPARFRAHWAPSNLEAFAHAFAPATPHAAIDRVTLW